MFENYEMMEETREGQQNEGMEQDTEMLNGDMTPESVGSSDYSYEARTNAWNEYNSLSEKDRETFLRGHSRNAHIMNMELRNERAGSTTGEGEAVGAAEGQEEVLHPSSYYEEQMANAVECRSTIAYNIAKSHWLEAKAREAAGSTTGEGEGAEIAEDKEAVGYSSSYYEHEMESALKNGNKIAYDNARSAWAKAKAKESVGSTTG